jgi:hypothetical protein
MKRLEIIFEDLYAGNVKVEGKEKDGCQKI